MKINTLSLFLCILSFSCQNKKDKTNSQDHPTEMAPGVTVSTISKCGCTSNISHYYEMLDYVNANDEIGLTTLRDKGALLLLKPDTEVKIIKVYPSFLDVRVLEGSHKEERCILPRKLVQ